MKILITIITSSKSPALVEISAMPRASPPAENVPKARLNPLLSVAPTNPQVKLKITLLIEAPGNKPTIKLGQIPQTDAQQEA